jgi:hypothetical protein
VHCFQADDGIVGLTRDFARKSAKNKLSASEIAASGQVLRSRPKTEGLTRIYTDETDSRTCNGKDEMLGFFAPLRMTKHKTNNGK